jgi:DNA-binding SARP family transcriptional activator
VPQQSRARARCCGLRLLGRWQLVADGEDVGLGHREERLTALLGLTGQSSRLHVAGTLWPESTDARALASLRRAVLQTQQRCPGLLQADRLSIGLDADVEVDVDQVRRAAAATEDAIAEGQGEAGALLGQLVGDELLPGWYDDWVLPERDGLEQLRVKALERIARQALKAGHLELSVDAARAASDIDSLQESATELLIRAHLGRGDPGSAVLEFGRYRDAVREELGVPPSRPILELIEPALAESRIDMDSERGELPEVAALTRPAAATPAVRMDTRGGEVPEVAALTRVAVEIPAVPPTVVIPNRPREPVLSIGGRGVVVRLLGVAALILAAALAVAGVGTLHDGGDTGAPGVVVHPQTGVLPADRAIRTVQMMVHQVDAAAGGAAFLVRTTAQPALVHLEVRGDAGWNLVRSVLVSTPNGRRLELSGLQPGIYRWLATSSLASAVSGQLRIPDPQVTVDTDEDVAEDVDDTVQAVGAAATVAPTPAVSPTPQPSSDRPPPRPTPRPNPTGPPKDPGTRPLTPVG